MSRHRMTTADAVWLHMDRPTNLMVVNSVLWFDEPLDHERAREVVRERLVERFPRFRQVVTEPAFGVGVPGWEDHADFDLDLHVHELALPAPGDQAALERLVSDLVAQPLDRAKPLWDIYLVDGYRSGTALVARMHHALADGIALARVLLSLTDERPDAGIAAQPAHNGHGRLAGLASQARTGAHLAQAGLHEGFELMAHPGSEIPGLAGQAVTGARALSKLLLTMPDAKTVLTGELGVSRKATWSRPLPLDAIKAAGHATGTTVNDLVVAALTGALHRYLVGRDSQTYEIRAMVPFNLRPLDQPLPAELGNRFGLVYLSLPVGIEHPATRLHEVHRRMEAIKHSPEAPLSYAILGAVGMTPLPVEQVLMNLFTPKTTMVLTNVPGPRRPVYFAGREVAGVLGWAPPGGSIGMSLSIFSYNGAVTVGLLVSPRLVPDPETIVRAFEEEMAVLLEVEEPAAPVGAKA